jgi:hypothetical protein
MITTSSKVTKIASVFLGLIYVVFGANFFLHFLPNPEVPPAAGAFLGALAVSGYMFPLIKITEIVGGALLLSGRGVPFALTLLAPITVNIAAFHFVLDPAGSPIALLLVALQAVAAWGYRKSFAPLFSSATANATRDDAPHSQAAAHA